MTRTGINRKFQAKTYPLLDTVFATQVKRLQMRAFDTGVRCVHGVVCDDWPEWVASAVCEWCGVWWLTCMSCQCGVWCVMTHLHELPVRCVVCDDLPAWVASAVRCVVCGVMTACVASAMCGVWWLTCMSCQWGVARCVTWELLSPGLLSTAVQLAPSKYIDRMLNNKSCNAPFSLPRKIWCSKMRNSLSIDSHRIRIVACIFRRNLNPCKLFVHWRMGINVVFKTCKTCLKYKTFVTLFTLHCY